MPSINVFCESIRVASLSQGKYESFDLRVERLIVRIGKRYVAADRIVKI